jgi:hypothetical protein
MTVQVQDTQFANKQVNLSKTQLADTNNQVGFSNDNHVDLTTETTLMDKNVKKWH